MKDMNPNMTSEETKEQKVGIRKTLVIMGPGGVGKSPLDALFKDGVIRLDPYRLRPNGPRGQGDKLYAPPELHDDLKGGACKTGLSIAENP